MGEFTMPSLGADMDRGTLLEWRVHPGDHVRRGDIVAVVDTEKSAVEVEVFETGVIDELLVEPGTEVEVGTPLARISAAQVAPSHPEPARARPGPANPRPKPGAAHHDPAVLSPLVRHLAEQLDVAVDRIDGTGPGHRVTRDDVVRAAGLHAGAPSGGSSPLARRLAAERGIDLAGVSGTGPGGSVRARDLPPDAPVETAAPATAPTPPRSGPAPRRDTSATAAGGADRQASIRQAIARQMAASNRDIPHYHLDREIDVHAATAWLARLNEDRSPAERVLPAALLVHAVAQAAARHPELNGHWVDDAFRPAEGVHLAVVVSLRGGGVVAPVLHDADGLDLDQTMATLADLVARARRGALRGTDVTGASVTLTDLGDRGADVVHGLIHPPQVALVGFGRIAERPVAVDGLLGIRRTVIATVAADHRATDGHAGSAFLATLDDLLGGPLPRSVLREAPDPGPLAEQNGH
jgi:pyruvate dehydrogenase E2 component (dihydrolipoamide acetyltransferase)